MNKFVSKLSGKLMTEIQIFKTLKILGIIYF